MQEKPVETCWIYGKPIPAEERIIDEFNFPCHIGCYPLTYSTKSERPKQLLT
jgi:hypothetical protein